VPVKTKRWNDPAEPDDGFRLLVCRYRPRGVARAHETWDEWWPELGPSKELHAAYWGKTDQAIGFPAYARRYLEEMQTQGFRIRALGNRVRDGETVTLLCSSACTNAATCHRTLLACVVERAGPVRAGRKTH
jgi:uncharacterized protein YeaO (DUF488 family)